MVGDADERSSSTEQGDPNVDRLDNTKGYLKSNVVACCRICNRIKGQQWSVEEMQAAMTAVREVRYKNRIVDSKQTGESV